MRPAYKWWEVFMTDHQAHSTAQLARIADADLQVLCVEYENSVRKGQGWTNDERLPLPIQLLPKRWLRFVVATLRSNPQCVHVFAGPFGNYKTTLAFLLATLFGCRVYLLTEPYSPVAYGYFSDARLRIAVFLKSKVRPALYRLHGLIFRNRVEGVFAVSPLAIEQLLKIGAAREKIFPFGYFVPSTVRDGAVNRSPRGSDQPIKVIYVGTLNHRKGLDLLVAAAAMLSAQGVVAQVDVYGHGDAARFGLDTATVRYCGPIAFGGAQQVMQEYDLLVLPSRYDGWGVVVNEAVLAGVPVVCSARVGAAAMIRKWGCGHVYEHGSARALADALGFAVADASALERMRQACRRLQPLLSPEAAGRYMYEVIDRKRLGAAPLNPWY